MSHSFVTSSQPVRNNETVLGLNAEWIVGIYRFLDYPLFLIIQATFPLHYCG
jgi:hypothetical protein